MICIFVSRDRDLFSDIEQALVKNHMDIEWIDTGKKLLSRISARGTGKPVELVIVDGNLPDENARDIVEQVIMQSPMTNCVASSSLSHKEFHEAYEGLGVLMQLPLKPNAQDAQQLVTHLNKILDMTA